VPFVGVESGQIAAGADVHRLGHLAVLESVAVGEAGLVLDRRQPGLEEIAPNETM
jgi:hypothetical protein